MEILKVLQKTVKTQEKNSKTPRRGFYQPCNKPFESIKFNL